MTLCAQRLCMRMAVPSAYARAPDLHREKVVCIHACMSFGNNIGAAAVNVWMNIFGRIEEWWVVVHGNDDDDDDVPLRLTKKVKD